MKEWWRDWEEQYWDYWIYINNLTEEEEIERDIDMHTELIDSEGNIVIPKEIVKAKKTARRKENENKNNGLG